MKKLRNALWALLALWLALLAALAWLLLMGAPETPQAAEDTAVHTITDIPVTQLSAVAVENAHTRFAVLQTPDGVEAITKTPGAYDDTQLMALLYAAGHLTGTRKNTDASTWAQYGADAPQATITLHLTNGSQQVLRVLMRDPLEGNGAYLFSEEEQAVYLVSYAVAELFLRQESDFLSHSVLPVVSREDYAGIERVTFDFAGKQRGYTVAQTDGAFALAAPIAHRLSPLSVQSHLLDYIAALYADRMIQPQADLSAYGFDEYDLKLTMTWRGKPYEALFVQHPEHGWLMADPLSRNVAAVDAQVMDALMQDYTVLLGGAVVSLGAGDVRSVDLLVDGSARTLDLSGSGEGLTGTIAGRAIAMERLRAFFTALNALPPTGEVTEDFALSAPALTLTLRLHNGSIEEILLTPATEGLYAVTIDEHTNFVTAEAAAQTLLSAVRALSDQE